MQGKKGSQLKKIGAQTCAFSHPPVITFTASVAGKKEGAGPLGRWMDWIDPTDKMNQESWEKAESAMAQKAVGLLLEKAKKRAEDVDYLLGGDLLNQCSATVFGVREFAIPFFGLFGACSTFGEALSLGAMLLDGGFGKRVICCAGSHFCAAEKQFRFPLGMGTQRPPSATWTVTGNGAALLETEGEGPRITHVTTGKIVDYGITDAANMGAAMAPAAADVILAHFRETGRTFADYTWVATGDLGIVGKQLLCQLLEEGGITPGEHLTDCGLELFDHAAQDTHAGGSGCACAAITYCSYFHRKLAKGRGRLLLVPTGALMNTTTSQQGLTIPGIAHAICIEGVKPWSM